MKKLGRKPARFTRRTFRSGIVMSRALDALGDPPAVSNDYVSAVTVPWGTMLNDQLGDCVCADTGHALMLRTANAGGIIVPTDAEIEQLYEVVGGYDPSQAQPNGDNPTDQGCDETSMCEYLQTTGFLGHKADAIGSVDPANLAHIEWCVQLFGTCRLGINLPQSALDQTDAGQPWDDIGDQNIVGGHDVPIVGYKGDTFLVVTWGQVQQVTRAFLANAAYIEEAHSELFFDWAQAQGSTPSGLSFDQLAADLKEISA
jgi:hypothetical protein